MENTTHEFGLAVVKQLDETALPKVTNKSLAARWQQRW
jgi:hypothetical protein